MLKNVRVVLVNTSHPGNIGGAARAMKNMGLSELVLVDPERFPDPDAVSRASGADDVLVNARIVATLEEAIADCSLVLGTSARDQQKHHDPRCKRGAGDPRRRRHARETRARDLYLRLRIGISAVLGLMCLPY